MDRWLIINELNCLVGILRGVVGIIAYLVGILSTLVGMGNFPTKKAISIPQLLGRI